MASMGAMKIVLALMLFNVRIVDAAQFWVMSNVRVSEDSVIRISVSGSDLVSADRRVDAVFEQKHQPCPTTPDNAASLLNDGHGNYVGNVFIPSGMPKVMHKLCVFFSVGAPIEALGRHSDYTHLDMMIYDPAFAIATFAARVGEISAPIKLRVASAALKPPGEAAGQGRPRLIKCSTPVECANRCSGGKDIDDLVLKGWTLEESLLTVTATVTIPWVGVGGKYTLCVPYSGGDDGIASWSVHGIVDVLKPGQTVEFPHDFQLRSFGTVRVVVQGTTDVTVSIGDTMWLARDCANVDTMLLTELGSRRKLNNNKWSGDLWIGPLKDVINASVCYRRKGFEVVTMMGSRSIEAANPHYVAAPGARMAAQFTASLSGVGMDSARDEVAFVAATELCRQTWRSNCCSASKTSVAVLSGGGEKLQAVVTIDEQKVGATSLLYVACYKGVKDKHYVIVPPRVKLAPRNPEKAEVSPQELFEGQEGTVRLIGSFDEHVLFLRKETETCASPHAENAGIVVRHLNSLWNITAAEGCYHVCVMLAGESHAVAVPVNAKCLKVKATDRRTIPKSPGVMLLRTTQAVEKVNPHSGPPFAANDVLFAVEIPAASHNTIPGSMIELIEFMKGPPCSRGKSVGRVQLVAGGQQIAVGEKEGEVLSGRSIVLCQRTDVNHPAFPVPLGVDYVAGQLVDPSLEVVLERTIKQAIRIGVAGLQIRVKLDSPRTVTVFFTESDERHLPCPEADPGAETMPSALNPKTSEGGLDILFDISSTHLVEKAGNLAVCIAHDHGTTLVSQVAVENQQPVMDQKKVEAWRALFKGDFVFDFDGIKAMSGDRLILYPNFDGSCFCGSSCDQAVSEIEVTPLALGKHSEAQYTFEKRGTYSVCYHASALTNSPAVTVYMGTVRVYLPLPQYYTEDRLARVGQASTLIIQGAQNCEEVGVVPCALSDGDEVAISSAKCSTLLSVPLSIAQIINFETISDARVNVRVLPTQKGNFTVCYRRQGVHQFAEVPGLAANKVFSVVAWDNDWISVPETPAAGELLELRCEREESCACGSFVLVPQPHSPGTCLEFSSDSFSALIRGGRATFSTSSIKEGKYTVCCGPLGYSSTQLRQLEIQKANPHEFRSDTSLIRTNMIGSVDIEIIGEELSEKDEMLLMPKIPGGCHDEPWVLSAKWNMEWTANQKRRFTVSADRNTLTWTIFDTLAHADEHQRIDFGLNPFAACPGNASSCPLQLCYKRFTGSWAEVVGSSLTIVPGNPTGASIPEQHVPFREGLYFEATVQGNSLAAGDELFLVKFQTQCDSISHLDSVAKQVGVATMNGDVWMRVMLLMTRYSGRARACYKFVSGTIVEIMMDVDDGIEFPGVRSSFAFGPVDKESSNFRRLQSLDVEFFDEVPDKPIARRNLSVSIISQSADCRFQKPADLDLPVGVSFPLLLANQGIFSFCLTLVENGLVGVFRVGGRLLVDERSPKYFTATPLLPFVGEETSLMFVGNDLRAGAAVHLHRGTFSGCGQGLILDKTETDSESTSVVHSMQPTTATRPIIVCYASNGSNRYSPVLADSGELTNLVGNEWRFTFNVSVSVPTFATTSVPVHLTPFKISFEVEISDSIHVALDSDDEARLSTRGCDGGFVRCSKSFGECPVTPLQIVTDKLATWPVVDLVQGNYTVCYRARRKGGAMYSVGTLVVHPPPSPYGWSLRHWNDTIPRMMAAFLMFSVSSEDPIPPIVLWNRHSPRADDSPASLVIGFSLTSKCSDLRQPAQLYPAKFGHKTPADVPGANSLHLRFDEDGDWFVCAMREDRDSGLYSVFSPVSGSVLRVRQPVLSDVQFHPTVIRAMVPSVKAQLKIAGDHVVVVLFYVEGDLEEGFNPCYYPAPTLAKFAKYQLNTTQSWSVVSLEATMNTPFSSSGDYWVCYETDIAGSVASWGKISVQSAPAISYSAPNTIFTYSKFDVSLEVNDGIVAGTVTLHRYFEKASCSKDLADGESSFVDIKDPWIVRPILVNPVNYVVCFLAADQVVPVLVPRVSGSLKFAVTSGPKLTSIAPYPIFQGQLAAVTLRNVVVGPRDLLNVASVVLSQTSSRKMTPSAVIVEWRQHVEFCDGLGTHSGHNGRLGSGFQLPFNQTGPVILCFHSHALGSWSWVQMESKLVVSNADPVSASVARDAVDFLFANEKIHMTISTRRGGTAKILSVVDEDFNAFFCHKEQKPRVSTIVDAPPSTGDLPSISFCPQIGWGTVAACFKMGGTSDYSFAMVPTKHFGTTPTFIRGFNVRVAYSQMNFDIAVYMFDVVELAFYDASERLRALRFARDEPIGAIEDCGAIEESDSPKVVRQLSVDAGKGMARVAFVEKGTYYPLVQSREGGPFFSADAAKDKTQFINVAGPNPSSFDPRFGFANSAITMEVKGDDLQLGDALRLVDRSEPWKCLKDPSIQDVTVERVDGKSTSKFRISVPREGRYAVCYKMKSQDRWRLISLTVEFESLKPAPDNVVLCPSSPRGGQILTVAFSRLGNDPRRMLTAADSAAVSKSMCNFSDDIIPAEFDRTTGSESIFLVRLPVAVSQVTLCYKHRDASHWYQIGNPVIVTSQAVPVFAVVPRVGLLNWTFDVEMGYAKWRTVVVIPRTLDCVQSCENASDTVEGSWHTDSKQVSSVSQRVKVLGTPFLDGDAVQVCVRQDKGEPYAFAMSRDVLPAKPSRYDVNTIPTSDRSFQLKFVDIPVGRDVSHAFLSPSTVGQRICSTRLFSGAKLAEDRFRFEGVVEGKYDVCFDHGSVAFVGPPLAVRLKLDVDWEASSEPMELRMASISFPGYSAEGTEAKIVSGECSSTAAPPNTCSSCASIISQAGNSMELRINLTAAVYTVCFKLRNTDWFASSKRMNVLAPVPTVQSSIPPMGKIYCGQRVRYNLQADFAKDSFRFGKLLAVSPDMGCFTPSVRKGLISSADIAVSDASHAEAELHFPSIGDNNCAFSGINYTLCFEEQGVADLVFLAAHEQLWPFKTEVMPASPSSLSSQVTLRLGMIGVAGEFNGMFESSSNDTVSMVSVDADAVNSNSRPCDGVRSDSVTLEGSRVVFNLMGPYPSGEHVLVACYRRYGGTVAEVIGPLLFPANPASIVATNMKNWDSSQPIRSQQYVALQLVWASDFELQQNHRGVDVRLSETPCAETAGQLLAISNRTPTATKVGISFDVVIKEDKNTTFYVCSQVDDIWAQLPTPIKYNSEPPVIVSVSPTNPRIGWSVSGSYINPVVALVAMSKENGCWDVRLPSTESPNGGGVVAFTLAPQLLETDPDTYLLCSVNLDDAPTLGATLTVREQYPGGFETRPAVPRVGQLVSVLFPKILQGGSMNLGDKTGDCSSSPLRAIEVDAITKSAKFFPRNVDTFIVCFRSDGDDEHWSIAGMRRDDSLISVYEQVPDELMTKTAERGVLSDVTVKAREGVLDVTDEMWAVRVVDDGSCGDCRRSLCRENFTLSKVSSDATTATARGSFVHAVEYAICYALRGQGETNVQVGVLSVKHSPFSCVEQRYTPGVVGRVHVRMNGVTVEAAEQLWASKPTSCNEEDRVSPLADATSVFSLEWPLIAGTDSSEPGAGLHVCVRDKKGRVFKLCGCDMEGPCAVPVEEPLGSYTITPDIPYEGQTLSFDILSTAAAKSAKIVPWDAACTSEESTVAVSFSKFTWTANAKKMDRTMSICINVASGKDTWGRAVHRTGSKASGSFVLRRFVALGKIYSPFVGETFKVSITPRTSLLPSEDYSGEVKLIVADGHCSTAAITSRWKPASVPGDSIGELLSVPHETMGNAYVQIGEKAGDMVACIKLTHSQAWAMAEGSFTVGQKAIRGCSIPPQLRAQQYSTVSWTLYIENSMGEISDINIAAWKVSKGQEWPCIGRSLVEAVNLSRVESHGAEVKAIINVRIHGTYAVCFRRSESESWSPVCSSLLSFDVPYPGGGRVGLDSEACRVSGRPVRGDLDASDAEGIAFAVTAGADCLSSDKTMQGTVSDGKFTLPSLGEGPARLCFEDGSGNVSDVFVNGLVDFNVPGASYPLLKYPPVDDAYGAFVGQRLNVSFYPHALLRTLTSNSGDALPMWNNNSRLDAVFVAKDDCSGSTPSNAAAVVSEDSVVWTAVLLTSPPFGNGQLCYQSAVCKSTFSIASLTMLPSIRAQVVGDKNRQGQEISFELTTEGKHLGFGHVSVIGNASTCFENIQLLDDKVVEVGDSSAKFSTLSGTWMSTIRDSENTVGLIVCYRPLRSNWVAVDGVIELKSPFPSGYEVSPPTRVPGTNENISLLFFASEGSATEADTVKLLKLEEGRTLSCGDSGATFGVVPGTSLSATWSAVVRTPTDGLHAVCYRFGGDWTRMQDLDVVSRVELVSDLENLHIGELFSVSFTILSGVNAAVEHRLLVLDAGYNCLNPLAKPYARSLSSSRDDRVMFRLSLGKQGMYTLCFIFAFTSGDYVAIGGFKPLKLQSNPNGYSVFPFDVDISAAPAVTLLTMNFYGRGLGSNSTSGDWIHFSDADDCGSNSSVISGWHSVHGGGDVTTVHCWSDEGVEDAEVTVCYRLSRVTQFRPVGPPLRISRGLSVTVDPSTPIPVDVKNGEYRRLVLRGGEKATGNVFLAASCFRGLPVGLPATTTISFAQTVVHLVFTGDSGSSVAVCHRSAGGIITLLGAKVKLTYAEPVASLSQEVVEGQIVHWNVTDARIVPRVQDCSAADVAVDALWMKETIDEIQIALPNGGSAVACTVEGDFIRVIAAAFCKDRINVTMSPLVATVNSVINVEGHWNSDPMTLVEAGTYADAFSACSNLSIESSTFVLPHTGLQTNGRSSFVVGPISASTRLFPCVASQLVLNASTEVVAAGPVSYSISPLHPIVDAEVTVTVTGYALSGGDECFVTPGIGIDDCAKALKPVSRCHSISVTDPIKGSIANSAQTAITSLVTAGRYVFCYRTQNRGDSISDLVGTFILGSLVRSIEVVYPVATVNVSILLSISGVSLDNEDKISYVGENAECDSSAVGVRAVGVDIADHTKATGSILVADVGRYHICYLPKYGEPTRFSHPLLDVEPAERVVAKFDRQPLCVEQTMCVVQPIVSMISASTGKPIQVESAKIGAVRLAEIDSVWVIAGESAVVFRDDQRFEFFELRVMVPSAASPFHLEVTVDFPDGTNQVARSSPFVVAPSTEGPFVKVTCAPQYIRWEIGETSNCEFERIGDVPDLEFGWVPNSASGSLIGSTLHFSPPSTYVANEGIVTVQPQDEALGYVASLKASTKLTFVTFPSVKSTINCTGSIEIASVRYVRRGDSLACTVRPLFGVHDIASPSTDFVFVLAVDGQSRHQGNLVPLSGIFGPGPSPVQISVPSKSMTLAVSARLAFSASNDDWLRGSPQSVDVIGIPTAVTEMSCETDSASAMVLLLGDNVNCSITALDSDGHVNAMGGDFRVQASLAEVSESIVAQRVSRFHQFSVNVTDTAPGENSVVRVNLSVIEGTEIAAVEWKLIAAVSITAHSPMTPGKDIVADAVGSFLADSGVSFRVTRSVDCVGGSSVSASAGKSTGLAMWRFVAPAGRELDPVYACVTTNGRTWRKVVINPLSITSLRADGLATWLLLLIIGLSLIFVLCVVAVVVLLVLRRQRLRVADHFPKSEVPQPVSKHNAQFLNDGVEFLNVAALHPVDTEQSNFVIPHPGNVADPRMYAAQPLRVTNPPEAMVERYADVDVIDSGHVSRTTCDKPGRKDRKAKREKKDKKRRASSTSRQVVDDKRGDGETASAASQVEVAAPAVVTHSTPTVYDLPGQPPVSGAAVVVVPSVPQNWNPPAVAGGASSRVMVISAPGEHL